MAKNDTATQGAIKPVRSDEFVGEGGWTGLKLVSVAAVTLIIVFTLLWIASPNVNPH
ncbi:MAG: hypothetical protein ACRELY_30500 [Polyangiaceae bacterium]